MRTRTIRTVVLLAALSLPATPAVAGWWDDLDKGESVPLADVFAQPDRFEGRTLTFFCVLLGQDKVFFPLHTPYTEARYDNFAVWPDGVPLWEADAFDRKALPYFYVDRRSAVREGLLKTDRLTRIEVTARIGTVWRATPFLEVLSWRRTGWRLGEETVQEMIRGDELAKSPGDESLPLALAAYHRALKPDLAPVYAVQVRRRVAEVLRRLGRYDEARAFEAEEPADSREPATDDGGPAAPVPAEGTAPPFVSSDLPGVPVGPPPESSDVPGTPVEPEAEAPAGERPLRVPVPRIPPKREPRLDGVK